MDQESNTWHWVDENGKLHDAKKVEEEFDSFIKISLKRIVRDLAEQYERQMRFFPVRPDDILDEVPAPEIELDCEKILVKLSDSSIPISDEELARVLQNLSKREKQFIELDLLNDFSDKDISKYLQIKWESVRRIRYRILSKLRNEMGVGNGKG